MCGGLRRIVKFTVFGGTSSDYVASSLTLFTLSYMSSYTCGLRFVSEHNDCGVIALRHLYVTMLLGPMIQEGGASTILALAAVLLVVVSVYSHTMRTT